MPLASNFIKNLGIIRARALVAELADAQRSGRCAHYERRGSSPLKGTYCIIILPAEVLKLVYRLR